MKELRALKRIIKLRNLPRTYENLLDKATKANIKVFNEREFYNYFKSDIGSIEKLTEPILVLKHDADHTLKPVSKILRLERMYNVRSTFHVRVDEKKYTLKNAKIVFKDCDVALHQVNDPIKEKKKLLGYFKDVIGISTHGGHESSTVFNKEFLISISNDFCYISDGLLRPGNIEYLNNMLLIPIDSADIYFEDPIKKLENAIKNNSIMIFNSHVEYFMPLDFLFKELSRKIRKTNNRII